MKKFFAVVLSLFIATSGLAQTRGGGTGGGTRTNTGGTGTGTNTGGGRTGTGTTGSGLGNFSSSGFGTTGSTGSTTSGLGQTSGTGGLGGFGGGFTFNNGLGMAASPLGMTGMSRSGFGGMGMGMGGMGMGMGMGGMGGGMGMGGGGRGGNGGMGGTGSTQQQNKIRPTVKLGFEVQAPTSTQRTQQFTSTIARLPQPERFAGVNVKVEGRKAIATGKLTSITDARLLKNLLLMEPGIYEVDITGLTGEKKDGSSPSDKNAEQVPAVPAPK